MVQLIYSQITTYHWKTTLVSTNLFVDVAAALKAVKKVPKTFEDLAIKLINAVPQRYSVVYFVQDTYFE